jgi:hypothetical protein
MRLHRKMSGRKRRTQTLSWFTAAFASGLFSLPVIGTTWLNYGDWHSQMNRFWWEIGLCMTLLLPLAFQGGFRLVSYLQATRMPRVPAEALHLIRSESLILFFCWLLAASACVTIVLIDVNLIYSFLLIYFLFSVWQAGVHFFRWRRSFLSDSAAAKISRKTM